MELFSKKYYADERFHSKYRLLNENPCLEGQREILQEWANGFVDRDGKVLFEFQTTFHSMFWEFYIHAILKKMGESIDFSKNRPDFIISNEDGSHKMYIEAVVSQIKNGGREEKERNFQDMMTTLTPLWKLSDFKAIIDEGIVRASNSINEKLKKYSKYSKLDWVDENVPYIVGLSSYSQINYGLESHYSIFALLYGLYVSDDGLSFYKKNKILKPNTESEIELNIFNKDEFSDISAIFFSSKVTLGKLANLAKSKGLKGPASANINLYFDDTEPYFKPMSINSNNPEPLEDGLIILHNPNAKKPLDRDIFGKHEITQVFFENGELEIDAYSPFLINRFHSQIHAGIEPVIKNMFWVDYNTPK